MIDVSKIDDPFIICMMYLKGHFVTDVISVLPYNVYRPDLLPLRFFKLRRFNIYQGYF